MRIKLLLTLSMATTNAVAATTHTVDETTGIENWETHENGVTFALTQILPDQARAFYVNRGFTLEQAEEYAGSCIYMTVLRNDSAPAVIHFKQEEWSIHFEGKDSAPIPTSDWMEKLKQIGVSKPAMIAFRWAQFPPEQEYEPGGDWNQGMLTTGLAAGTTFDITARWHMNNQQYQGTLENVRCAKDNL